MMSPYYAGGLGIPYMMVMGGLGELHPRKAASTRHRSRAEPRRNCADGRRVRDGDGDVRHGRNGWLRLPIRHDGYESVCLHRHGEPQTLRTRTIGAGRATWKRKKKYRSQ